jgi:thioredoxin-like negative regulator of GroEL
MTHESRAKLIKRIFFLALVGVIALIFYYLPGDPASGQLSAILDKVEKKYGKQTIVSRVDFKANPEAAKKEGVTEAPHVVIISGKEKAFEFGGLWTQQQVESKVEEILHGLKRVDKDWRPVVPGMKRTGQ